MERSWAAGVECNSKGVLLVSFWGRNVNFRLVAGIAATSLAAGGALAMATISGANAADVTLNKSLNYRCNVTAGSLNLRTHTVGVPATTTVPAAVR